MKKLLTLVAITGLTRPQRELLKQLAKKHKPFFRAIGEILSKDEDFTRANMMSPALGTEVLRRQVESEKQEKIEIQQLKECCRKAGIAEWRIKLVI